MFQNTHTTDSARVKTNCEGFCSRSPRESAHRPKTETNQSKLPDQGSDTTVLTGWQEKEDPLPQTQPGFSFVFGFMASDQKERPLPDLADRISSVAQSPS